MELEAGDIPVSQIRFDRINPFAKAPAYKTTHDSVVSGLQTLLKNAEYRHDKRAADIYGKMLRCASKLKTTTHGSPEGALHVLTTEATAGAPEISLGRASDALDGEITWDRVPVGHQHVRANRRNSFEESRRQFIEEIAEQQRERGRLRQEMLDSIFHNI